MALLDDEENRASFGFFPQMQPRRRLQDVQGAANLPVDVTRARFAGLLGLIPDVLNFMGRSPMPTETFGETQYDPRPQLPYDTDFYLKNLPLAPTSRAGQVASQVGSLVPLNPAPLIRAGVAGAQALAPTAARMTENFLQQQGLMLNAAPPKVGKSSITKEGNPIQGAVVLVGDKMFIGRTHGDALNRAIYEGVVRKEGGKYIFPKGAEVNSDLFITKDGQIIDRLQASRMFDIGASETAIEKGLMQNNPPKSMTIDSYIEQATALKKQRQLSPAPQQAALDLAQQRAALPVEQGGLGLPAGNTPAQRAKAMGFDYNTTRFHGSDQDIYAFDPAKFGKNDQGWYGRGVTTDTDPEIASGYANYNEAQSGQTVYPLVSRGKYMNWPEGQQPFSSAKDSARGTKDIEALGYQGTRVTNDRDLYGNTPQFGTEQVTFNPENIRSRFAAFDPFRRSAAIAATMGAAAPDLLAAQQDEEMRKLQQLGLLGMVAP